MTPWQRHRRAEALRARLFVVKAVMTCGTINAAANTTGMQRKCMQRFLELEGLTGKAGTNQPPSQADLQAARDAIVIEANRLGVRF